MLVDEGNSHGDADCVVAGSGGCLQTKFKILFCDMDGTHASLSLSLSTRKCGFSHTKSRSSWHMCEVNKFVVSSNQMLQYVVFIVACIT